MARRPTDAEWNSLRSGFPYLSRPTVWVLGERTYRYNCLAWALGRTDRWIWPWGQGVNPPVAQMSAFLRQYGFTPGSPTLIGAYGPGGIAHVGRFHVSSPTSKLGGGLLITHTWAGLNYGFYGSWRQTYRRTALLDADPGDIEGVEIRPEDPDLPPLSSFEADRLRERVDALKPDVRQAFESAYDEWMKTWSLVPPVLDSTGSAVTFNLEFINVVNQAQDALPLLMEKLADPDQHFALRVAERVLQPEFVPMIDPESPEALEGEQYRARLTLSNWLSSD